MRHDYPYYHDKFEDRILRISGAKFFHSVAHVYLQTSNSASFTVEIATKFWGWCQRWLSQWDEVACCHVQGGQRNTLSNSRCKSLRRNGNSENKVLTITLYTAASVFWTGDSLTPFRDFNSWFQCRSARLTASRSFGYLCRWGHADTWFK